MKGEPGTCHYCSNRATQNLVWLKPKRLVLPHCGCDFEAVIRRLAPANSSQLGVDYMIETVAPPLPRATGDGVRVVIEVDNSWVRENGKTTSIVMPKAEARKLSRDIMSASQRPEPGCTDDTDHFRGHCGCK